MKNSVSLRVIIRTNDVYGIVMYVFLSREAGTLSVADNVIVANPTQCPDSKSTYRPQNIIELNYTLFFTVKPGILYLYRDAPGPLALRRLKISQPDRKENHGTHRFYIFSHQEKI